jgi:hypothetical protein
MVIEINESYSKLDKNNFKKAYYNYVPFSFARRNKIILITIFSMLMLLYVNLGLPYRVRHREERDHYTYWFV